jgi:hypothetical protein
MVEFAQAAELSTRRPQAAPDLPRPLSLSRAVATFKSMWPLPRKSFERQLENVVRNAPAARVDFYIGDYAARRALRGQLIVDVDPATLRFRLKHRSDATSATRYLQDKFAGGGAWSELLEPLSASSTHREVAEIVATGYDYRRTRAYASALRHAAAGDPIRRNFVALRTAALVESYFRLTTELCRSIRDQGVMRRSACPGLFNVVCHPRVRLPWVELTESEIGVAVDAQGQIYRFGSGKHRTAAAQAIGLRTMPVEIRMVHISWLRRQIADSGLPPVEALLNGLRGLTRSAE